MSDRFDSQAKRLIERFRVHGSVEPLESQLLADRVARAIRRSYRTGHERGMLEGIRTGGRVAISAMRGTTQKE